MLAPILWYSLLCLVGIDIIWFVLAPVALAPDSFLFLLGLLPWAIICAWASRRLTTFPRLRLLAEGGLFMMLAWPALRLFNHLSMTTEFPLADAGLASADAMLGFDWLAYLL